MDIFLTTGNMFSFEDNFFEIINHIVDVQMEDGKIVDDLIVYELHEVGKETLFSCYSLMYFPSTKKYVLEGYIEKNITPLAIFDTVKVGETIIVEGKKLHIKRIGKGVALGRKNVSHDTYTILSEDNIEIKYVPHHKEATMTITRRVQGNIVQEKNTFAFKPSVQQ